MDIFSLIREDHQKVSDLFSQIKGTRGASGKRAQLFAQIKEELEIHSHAEEQVFYAALQGDDVAYDMALDAIEDHRLVAELLEELATASKDGEEWEEKLQVLEENVEDHVEEEESEIFEAASQLFSNEQAQELGKRFQAVKREQLATRSAK
jgi:hemerythrin superfamily protein